MLTHWSQFVPNMSTDIRGLEVLHRHLSVLRCRADIQGTLLLGWETGKLAGGEGGGGGSKTY